MPMNKKEFLIEFLDYVEVDGKALSPEKKQLLVDRLFKYDGNIAVENICEIVNALLPEHKKFMEYMSSAAAPIGRYCLNEFPLIILSPKSPTELRVYKNIVLAHHNVTEVSTSSFAAIQPIISKYEEEYAGAVSGIKWQNTKVYLEEFVDMPTARALTRFVFTDGALKDNEIRDFANLIDNDRKPAQLEYAITPQDFTKMYKTGPHSCMAFTATDRKAWEFFDQFDMCPASWYSYYPYTKGAYITKNGKTIARAILFNKPGTDIWEFGRVYGDTSEIAANFKKALESNNIYELAASHNPGKGFTFTMPGIKLKDGRIVAPWPYFDNLPRDDVGRDQFWGIGFDPKTNEFTVQCKPTKLAHVNNRAGHIIGKDYILLECDCCGNRVNNNMVIQVEGGEATFCSNRCATDSGYSLVIDGQGNRSFRKSLEDCIPLVDDHNTYFSTLKAATDNGCYPLMEEVGIFPEDNAIKVCHFNTTRINAANGTTYNLMSQFNTEPFKPSKVPLHLLPAKTLVEFREDSELIVEAA